MLLLPQKSIAGMSFTGTTGRQKANRKDHISSPRVSYRGGRKSRKVSAASKNVKNRFIV